MAFLAGGAREKVGVPGWGRRSLLEAGLLRFLDPSGARPERSARYLPAQDGPRGASACRGGRPGTPPAPPAGGAAPAPAPPPAPPPARDQSPSAVPQVAAMARF